MDVDLTKFERTDKARSVDFDFKVGDLPADGVNEERTLYATLSVSHHKAGFNHFNSEWTTEDYFSVSLTNEVVGRREGSGFTSRSYMMFSGLGLKRISAGNRYSKKKLLEAADEGYALLAALVEEANEKVLAYFDGSLYNEKHNDKVLVG